MNTNEMYIFASAGAAFLAVVAAGRSFIERDARAAQLKMLRERRAELQGSTAKSRRRRRPERHVNFMRLVVERFQLLKSKGVSQVQSLLVEAGWRSKDALVVYLFFTAVAPIVLGIIGIVLLTLPIWTGKYAIMRFAVPIALTYAGLKLPMWVAAWKRRRRYYRIRRALSDTLDLMTICAEAGLTLSVAIDRVSRELGIAYPDMAQELGLTSMELGLLPERDKAFINLTERVKIPEIRGIVSVLLQTEKYGTPVAQALRVLSAEFREQRILAAENKAAKLGPMMTVPMICFILPTMFVIIIAPAAIRIMETMK